MSEDKEQVPKKQARKTAQKKKPANSASTKSDSPRKAAQKTAARKNGSSSKKASTQGNATATVPKGKPSPPSPAQISDEVTQQSDALQSSSTEKFSPPPPVSSSLEVSQTQTKELEAYYKLFHCFGVGFFAGIGFFSVVSAVLPKRSRKKKKRFKRVVKKYFR